ncbi:MAG: DNA cytosine methyltransferase [Planctomycetes bacterium]|nr:DNA cytosine methyltransferase [Planctomycetota bacterium]
MWDDLIEGFHAPAGRFAGVIGGPPCQHYSDANRRRNTAEGDRLLREFLRVVDEARPQWFLMENVRNVPDVRLHGYAVQRLDINDLDCGGRQRRLRHIQFGHVDGHIIRPPRTNGSRPVTPIPTITTKQKSRHARHCRRSAAQGLQTPLPLRSLTKTARRRVIGNAVPLSIGLALADAVNHRGRVTGDDCVCGCGRRITPPARHAGAACRKRMQRRRDGQARSVTFVRLQLRHAAEPPIEQSHAGSSVLANFS